MGAILAFLGFPGPTQCQSRRPPVCAMGDTSSNATTLARDEPSIGRWPYDAVKKHAGAEAPHAGSYYVSRSPSAPFFEGWYLRLVMPNSTRSFAFMFSIESSGPGTMQLLDDKDCLHKLALSPSHDSRFFGDKRRLSIGHWGYTTSAAGPPRELSAAAFESSVLQGYQLSSSASHGRFMGDNGLVQWGFEFSPVLSWGERGNGSRCTATWMSRLPMFDPGYQVLIAHGVATGGYLRVGTEEVDVSGAAVYCEKNWGSAFPKRWWWIQANSFDDEPDLSVTALGSTRRILAFEEVIGMIAVHFQGKLFEFSNCKYLPRILSLSSVPYNTAWRRVLTWLFVFASVSLKGNCETLDWDVSVWGSWKASATAMTGHTAELVATTSEGPVEVLGPSQGGMIYNVLDNARGALTLTVRDSAGNAVLDRVECRSAQVEIGGGPWPEPWKATVRKLPQPIRGAINLFHRPKVQTSP